MHNVIYEAIEESKTQCTLISNDLQQLLSIMNDAVPTIIKSFNSIYSCTEDQKELTDVFLHQASATEINKSTITTLQTQLNSLYAEAGNSVDKIMMALQFHDMSNQLAINLIKRLHLIEKLLEACSSETIKPLHTTTQQPSELLSLHEDIKMLKHLALTTPVSQQSVDSGDIELF